MAPLKSMILDFGGGGALPTGHSASEHVEGLKGVYLCRL